MFNLNLGKKLGAAAIIALGTMSSAQAIVLDSFNWDTPVDEEFAGGFVGATSTGDSFITNQLYPGLLPVPVTVEWSHHVSMGVNESELTAGHGIIRHDNDSGVVSTLTLNYFAEVPAVVDDPQTPADETAPAFKLPLDVTAFGDAFYFDTLFSGEGIQVDITLTDVTSTSETEGRNSNEYDGYAVDPFNPTAERGFLEFSSFDTVDLTSITEIMIHFTAPGAAPDFTVAEFGITNVPAPTTLAIFGLGLLGLGAARRRKA